MFEHDDFSESVAVLPWSVEAETAVLGSLLLSPDRFDSVADILTDKMFHRPLHRAVFAAIASLVNSCKAVDVVIVYEMLEQAGEVGTVSLVELNELAQYTASPANVRRYAEIIAERALMRGLLAASDKAREIATEPGLGAPERLDRCMDQFQALTVSRGASGPSSVGEIAVTMVDRVQDLYEGRIEPGIKTGFRTLDMLMAGGFKPGKQIVIAARPSVGKSVVALNIAKVAAQAGHPAAFLSLEMEKGELGDRLAADIGSIELDHLATGKLADEEWTGLTNAIEILRTLPLYVDDHASMTLGDIQARARKLKREHGIKVLVVDYMQLIAPSDQKASRHHQLEAISRGLKVLAKQLGLTTVLLSQLNRDVDKRVGNRPNLGDLKESGAIEEDADAVVFLSNDEVREDGIQVIHAELAKNRGGRKGFFKMALTGKFQRVQETSAMPNTRFASAPKPTYTEDF